MAVDYEQVCRAIFDRLYTSSTAATKVVEVIRILDDAGITSAVKPRIVTTAIAVRVEGVADDDQAEARVEEELRRVFRGEHSASSTGTATLVALCTHSDPDVLFHEDGPCPPLNQEG